MSQVLLFKSDGHEFPLEILNRNEQKWVARKQLSGALGVSDLRELHSQLVRKGELREGTHFMTITVMYPDGNAGRGNPSRVAYSYRGVIRVSMHCEGSRAVRFRTRRSQILQRLESEQAGQRQKGPGHIQSGKKNWWQKATEISRCVESGKGGQSHR